MSTDIALLLNIWQYAETSILRIIAGWGREAGDWEDKLAICYHVWLQAEIVDRIRRRVEQFPGRNPADMPVDGVFETVCNTAFLAPTWTDAMAGVQELLNPALIQTYYDYLAASHPVHDKPTHDILREILHLKSLQTAWYESFRRCTGHRIEAAYARRVREQLSRVNNFATIIEARQQYARACGKHTDFRMPIVPGRVKDWDAAPNVMPLIELDWNTSVETRRLYFMIGYFWEMGVAEDQLRWIFYADFMPWEFIHAECRHMWDESRHGNSGLTRLRDFGLDIKDIGYSSYNKHGEGRLEPMTPHDVYNAFYSVTQIAETGYFKTKGYCFEDFAAGGDQASAEMMQFDIIDETAHTEYGRQWLNVMMERAGIEEDYRKRGLSDRELVQQGADARVAAYRECVAGTRPDTDTACQNVLNPQAQAHYQWLLETLRRQCPLSNAATAPWRPNLPM
jgi:hypothetical protein